MRASLAILLLLAACGDDQQVDADASMDPDADSNADPLFPTSAGAIVIEEGVERIEDEQLSYGRVFAHISEDTAPWFHTETMREGSCRLLEFTQGFCDPFCPGICVEDGVCVDFPSYAAAGPIAIDGLTQPITLTSEAPYHFYNPTAFPINEDLFGAGDPIAASAPGATIPAFEVGATGVATLELDFDDLNFTITDGQDAVIEWTPAGSGRVRLTLNSRNDAHGLPLNAIIECDGPDTGSITVPQALVEAFPPASGYGICVSLDCPSSHLQRYSRGTTTAGATEVELWVASKVTFGVVH